MSGAVVVPCAVEQLFRRSWTMDCRPCKWSLAVAVVVLVCLQGTPSMADVIHVDADASSGGNGESWSQAYDDLQDAFSKPPSSGDEIWVADGTYRPGTSRSDSFDLVDGVDVYGGFAGTESNRLECTGTSTSCTDDTDCNAPKTCDDQRDIEANLTILDSKTGQTKTFQIVVVDDCDTNGCRLDGFTITGGGADGNEFFPPIGPNDGAGIFVDGGTLDLANCVVKNNAADDKGAGMYVIGGATVNVKNCTFDTNDAILYGGGIYNTSDNLEVVNSIFVENESPFGGGMYTTGDTSVLNCTFANNTTLVAGRGAGIHVGTADATIRNSIFWGNAGGTSTNEADQVAGTTVDIKYSCVQGCDSGSGGLCETAADKNIGTDPLFLDAPDDLHVKWGSRTIDGGDSDEVDWDEDSDGNDRKCDTPWMTDSGDATSEDVVDMGVYEVCGSTIVYVDSTAEGDKDGTTWTHAYTDFQSALSNTNALDEVWVSAGTYKPSVTNPSSSNDREKTFLLPSGVAFFGGFANTESNRAECSGGTDPCFDDADCTGTCDDKRAGSGTILSGDLDGDDTINEIDCDDADVEEWNSGGSYCERIFFQGFMPQSTCEDILGQTWKSAASKCQFNTGLEQTNDDENCLHVVTADASSANAVIDGFTITAGNADRTGFCNGGDNPGALCDGDSDCTGTSPVENGMCKTLHNQGGGFTIRDVGLATVIDNDITVRNCTFTGNVATDHAGGLNDHGVDTVIADCTFDGNFSAKRGGGLYLHDSAAPTLTDCTFLFNTSILKGGALYKEDNGDPTITGCVFANNWAIAQGGGGAWVDGGSPTFSDCQFFKNVGAGDSSASGGGLYVANGAATIDGCTFVECVGMTYGGGLGYAGDVDVGDLKNSVFVRNISGVGGGVGTKQFSPEIASCVFVGNTTHRGWGTSDNGGAIFSAQPTGVVTVSNTLIVGNSAQGLGSAFHHAGGPCPVIELANCTIVDNDTRFGAAIAISNGDDYMSIVNSIVQRNLDTSEIDNSFGNPASRDYRFYYSNIIGWDGTDTATCVASKCVGGFYDDVSCSDDDDCQGNGVCEGTPKECVGGFYDGECCTDDTDCKPTGIIDASADDIFLAAVEENWDRDGLLQNDDSASFDPDTYETTFTDESKSETEWDNDELKGLVFHLGHWTGNSVYSVVTRSSGNTFTVWGNLKDEFEALPEDDDTPYAILDYHYVDCAAGIDAGDNCGVPQDITDVDNDGDPEEELPTDLDGSSRKVNDTGVTDTGNGTAPIVDMGAFEKTISSCPP